MKLTRREKVALYTAVVAATWGQLTAGRVTREKPHATAQLAHERGMLAVREAGIRRTK